MLCFSFCKKNQCFCFIILSFLFPFLKNPVQRCMQIFELHLFHCITMSVKQLYIRDTGKTIRILCNFHRITVTAVHHDLTDISSEDFRQKLKHILLLFFHGLCLVPQDRHLTWKQFLQKHKLNPGIILHFIHYHMLDSVMSLASEQRIFQIKYRIYIFITKFSFFKRKPWKCFITFLFQKTAVQYIAVSCLIHLLETLGQLFLFFICKISVPQCFHLVNEIFCYCFHSGKKRDIQEFEIKKIYDFFFFQNTAFVLYILEIHQVIFHAKHKSIQLAGKFC